MYSSLRHNLSRNRKRNRNQTKNRTRNKTRNQTWNQKSYSHFILSPPSLQKDLSMCMTTTVTKTIFLPYHLYPCLVLIVGPEHEWDEKIRTGVVWGYKLFRNWNIPHQHIHILSYDFTLSSTPPTFSNLEDVLKTSSSYHSLFVYVVDPVKVSLVKWGQTIQQWFSPQQDDGHIIHENEPSYDFNSDILNRLSRDGYSFESMTINKNRTMFLMLDTGVLCHKDSLRNHIHDTFNL